MSPRLGPGPRKVVAALLVALLTLGLWWLESRGDDPAPSTGATSGSSPSPVAPEPRADAESDAESGVGFDAEGIPYVDLADLPVEAAEVMDDIDAGGPFAHPGKDGSTFGNREGLLPDRAYGYYAEYTVPTPGEDDRGARRIIGGDGGERYWTADHYESFERIRR